HGRAIASDRRHLLAYESPAPFDVVLTNSFLGYFDADGRRRLVRVWHRLLRPGGKAVFTNRLRSGANSTPVGFTGEQIRRLADTVRGEAQRWRSVFGFHPEEKSTGARRDGEPPRAQ